MSDAQASMSIHLSPDASARWGEDASLRRFILGDATREARRAGVPLVEVYDAKRKVVASVQTAVTAPPPGVQPLPFQYNDGGRQAAGYKGTPRDCVTRAIAIATGLPYQDVYAELNRRAQSERPRKSRRSSARTGVKRRTYEPLLLAQGFTWVPTMKVGQGTRVHLRQGELPAGRLVAAVSGHLCAVVGGVVQDTSDPTRHGTRCVYGYYLKKEEEQSMTETKQEEAPAKLTDNQLRALARCIGARIQGKWARATHHGERVTLASLHGRGLVERQAWRGKAGEANTAYEYRATADVLAAWKAKKGGAR